MPETVSALGILDKSISVTSEFARFPELLRRPYRSGAQDLPEICTVFLAANENLSRWLYRFL